MTGRVDDDIRLDPIQNRMNRLFPRQIQLIRTGRGHITQGRDGTSQLKADLSVLPYDEYASPRHHFFPYIPQKSAFLWKISTSLKPTSSIF